MFDGFQIWRSEIQLNYYLFIQRSITRAQINTQYKAKILPKIKKIFEVTEMFLPNCIY